MTKISLLTRNCNSLSDSVVNYGLDSTKQANSNKSRLAPSPRSLDIGAQRASSDKPRRTRRAHNKTRTGCLTCKIRRKKCDETKPACLRCTNTGRKCDGYARAPPAQLTQVFPATAATTITTPNPLATQQRAPRGIELDTDSGYCTSHLDATNDADTINEEELDDFILNYGSNATSYAASPAASHSGNNHKRRRLAPSTDSITLALSCAPNFSTFINGISDLESHCFSYFRHHTGPQFASYFDSSIWCAYTICGALAHPVLFSVAAAVGAVHRRFSYGISPAAFEYCGHAARLYAKAVRRLSELKSQQVNPNMIGTTTSGGSGMDVHDRDVIMVSEMLLGLFMGFQGEYSKVVSHMNNGLKYLLGRPMTLCHSETRYCNVESKGRVFCHLFRRIHMRALALFDTPTRILVKWGDGLPLLPIPDIFVDIEEARDYLFTEVDWIMHAPARVWQSVTQRSEAQKVHVSRLLKWGVAYAETIRDLDRTPRQKRACILMKLMRGAMQLLLYLMIHVAVDTDSLQMPDMTETTDDDEEQDQSLAYATRALWNIVQRREELTTNMARVQILAEGILEEGGVFDYEEHSVSFDTSIGPPKTAERVPEASNKTRHLVKTSVETGQNKETPWEILGVYGVAERLSAMEEHAVIEAAKGLIPAHVDPRWVDITCFMEGRRILLRYCRPDEWGLGMVWTQQWWAF